MAKGKFRLYYVDMDVQHPCANVFYRIMAGESLLLAGSTDANGETPPVGNGHIGGKIKLEVRDWREGGYAEVETFDTNEDAVIDIGAPNESGIRLKTLRVKPYYRLHFAATPGFAPIKGARFAAYTKDSQSRETVATTVDGKAVRGSTDERGYTGTIYCARPVEFRFEHPALKVTVSSRLLTPLVKGQRETHHFLPFKTIRAQTTPNPTHQVGLAGKKSLPALVSLEDQELLMVSQDDFDEFEEFSGHLEQVLANQHLAKADLARALESRSQEEIAKAEKALGLAEDKVKSELNKNFEQSADLKEMVVFESYDQGKDKGNKLGMRRRYIPKKKLEELKARKFTTKHKLEIRFPVAPGASGKSSVSPKQLDTEALKKSFEKIKTEIKSSKKWEGDPHVLNLFDVAGNQLSETIKHSDSYEVEKSAQWLRLVGCAGASAEASWKDKRVQLQGNLQGKLVLAEGQYTMRYAVPSLKGWMMSIGDEDLGAIRFVAECTLYGFAGAKVVASGAVGVSLKDGKAIVQGIKRDPNTGYRDLIDPKTKLPKFEPAALNSSTPEDVTGVKAEIGAFAGVEGGITPAGKMQWLPPQEKEFVSFAEVSATLAANAGAGANLSLNIYYANGRFRIKVAARLCWGVGAKGALEFVVNAEKMAEFVKWFYYQLLHLGFKAMVFVTKAAFEALSKLLFMLIVDPNSDVGKLLTNATRQIDAAFDDLIASLDRAREREAMVNGINRSPHWLIYATPETRGMLLYQITRHDAATHSRDIPSVETGKDWYNPEVHYLDAHKKAVLKILAPIQTRAEWANVMQHMTTNGERVLGDATKPRSAQEPPRTNGEAEGDVLRFLNYGKSLTEDLKSIFSDLNLSGALMTSKDEPDTGNNYINAYLKKRKELVNAFPKGYKVAMSEFDFDMLRAVNGKQHVMFAMSDPAPLLPAPTRDSDSHTMFA
ncbi:MAG: hypothetical protein QM776_05170 [Rhodocyclaceae bacterium]